MNYTLNNKGGLAVKKYTCIICGFIYDEAQGIPESGIKPGTQWENLEDDWTCPLCGALKENFEEVEQTKVQDIRTEQNHEELGKLLNAEMSALFSNLAKGAGKQYLEEESALFTKLAEYYAHITSDVVENSFSHIMLNVDKDLKDNYPIANAIAADKEDRGAKRALLWTEKVTKIISSILLRYEKEGNELIGDKKVHVCEICGFIYIGNDLPDVCPVCKVPKFKITEIRR